MVWFSTSLFNSDGTSDTYAAIFSGGTIVQHTERVSHLDDGKQANVGVPFATNGLVTVNGSQAIEVRWYENSTGTASVLERTLNIMKVS